VRRYTDKYRQRTSYHWIPPPLLPYVIKFRSVYVQGSSWPWSYDSWIYNYLCNRCLSSLMLWVRISIRARCTTLCDKVCQWLAAVRWFSPGTPVSYTNKTDSHDITYILLKMVLNTVKETNTHTSTDRDLPVIDYDASRYFKVMIL
jgi:hypothetical protein